MGYMKDYVLAIGCSFTDPNYRGYYILNGPSILTPWKKWPEIVADHYNMDCVNLARGGTCTANQYHAAMDFLVEKQLKGEKLPTLVLWGLTGPDRTAIINEKDTSMIISNVLYGLGFADDSLISDGKRATGEIDKIYTWIFKNLLIHEKFLLLYANKRNPNQKESEKQYSELADEFIIKMKQMDSYNSYYLQLYTYLKNLDIPLIAMKLISGENGCRSRREFKSAINSIMNNFSLENYNLNTVFATKEQMEKITELIALGSISQYHIPFLKEYIKNHFYKLVESLPEKDKPICWPYFRELGGKTHIALPNTDKNEYLVSSVDNHPGELGHVYYSNIILDHIKKYGIIQ